MKYDSFVIGSDEDLEVLFHCHRQYPEVRTAELLAKLIDVVSNIGGSNRNTQTPGTAAGSSSRHVGASSSVPVIAPQDEPVASPSFTVDLNRSGGGEVGIVDRVPIFLQCGAPASMDDALPDDDDADDVESDIIADDSGDDITASNLEGVAREPTRFGARDTHRTGGLLKFQVGQRFQDKGGVQYKVVDSDYRKYLGKCTEFGKGCTWLIRISLHQRKGIWEVKQYNRPHTCLATSISSDHRSLDYHVISVFIMPMVRAVVLTSCTILFICDH
ncbi:hypothetical protein Ahy_A04g020585 isoform E [Arachis hypogaea]|uniref:Transposase MuDR plant domain-containing protein n=1 Tax=Arachis hypogaea TaxID=3818 RepID=A0A445DI27_ARAHY|nr:hypothetical protein Ahy_A04g020585 isoform E [Arachis hypogaea]